MYNQTSANSADHVFSACRGRYVELFAHYFPGESERAIAHMGRGVPDPWRGSKKDGFRLSKDFNESGKMFFNQNVWGVSSPCINFYRLMLLTGKVRDAHGFFVEVGRYLGLPEYLEQKPTAADKARFAKLQKEARAREEAFKAAAARREALESARAREENSRVWKRTVPLFRADGKPNPEAREVWMYFRTRGLEGLEDAAPRDLAMIRCAKALPYHDEEKGGAKRCYPAMVCRVQAGDGTGVTLHRTYLLQGRKAPVESPKKLMPSDHRVTSRSRYIRIGGDVADGVIGIAEGVETALSCYLATGLPVYSCVSATLLKEFEPGAGVHSVVVFADKDASMTGGNAAKVLKERLASEGYQCFIVMPKSPIPQGSKGVDWNDELKSKGAAAFPTRKAILKTATDHLVSRGRLLARLLEERRRQAAAAKAKQ